MRSPVKMFPKSWKTDITVLRGGGRDRFDNPIPAAEIAREGVMIAPRATADPVDFSELVDSRAVLYDDAEDGFRYMSTDRIRVPAGARMAGEWSIDGRPGEWVLGNEIVLVRA